MKEHNFPSSTTLDQLECTLWRCFHTFLAQNQMTATATKLLRISGESFQTRGKKKKVGYRKCVGLRGGLLWRGKTCILDWKYILCDVSPGTFLTQLSQVQMLLPAFCDLHFLVFKKNNVWVFVFQCTLKSTLNLITMVNLQWDRLTNDKSDRTHISTFWQSY